MIKATQTTTTTTTNTTLYTDTVHWTWGGGGEREGRGGSVVAVGSNFLTSYSSPRSIGFNTTQGTLKWTRIVTTIQSSVFESTNCDAETSSTHFPVPFGPIFQIFVVKIFVDLFF